MISRPVWLFSIALLAGLAAACQSPHAVSLAQTAREQESPSGARVETEGTVRAFDDQDGAPYYVLEDARHDRVLLQPHRSVAPFVDHDVTVIGIFEFRERGGRTITVDSIALVGARVVAPMPPS